MNRLFILTCVCCDFLLASPVRWLKLQEPQIPHPSVCQSAVTQAREASSRDFAPAEVAHVKQAAVSDT